MVVEDEDLLLQAISKKLALSGVGAISCSGGAQALDYLKNLPELPDAIWLDYHLKDMDGLSFMKQLKSHPGWSRIPVVVVSNSASPDKVDAMLALGANKYLLKADHFLDEIIQTIKEFIKTENKDQ